MSGGGSPGGLKEIDDWGMVGIVRRGGRVGGDGEVVVRVEGNRGVVKPESVRESSTNRTRVVGRMGFSPSVAGRWGGGFSPSEIDGCRTRVDEEGMYGTMEG